MSGIKQEIIRKAKGLMQKSGFEGLEFHALAELAGIERASIYDHFSSKEELGVAVMEHSYQSFRGWTQTVEQLGPTEKVSAFFDLFLGFLRDDFRICPVSAATLEAPSLPVRVRVAVQRLIDFQYVWLDMIIADGQTVGEFPRTEPVAVLRNLIYSMAIVGQQTARLRQDESIFMEMKNRVLALLQSP